MKFAFIGAGSFGFTRKLVRDILSFPALQDCEIALMDINAKRLEYIEQAVKKIVAAGNYPTGVTATMDRAEALRVPMALSLLSSRAAWMCGVPILKFPRSTGWISTSAIPGVLRESSGSSEQLRNAGYRPRRREVLSRCLGPELH